MSNTNNSGISQTDLEKPPTDGAKTTTETRTKGRAKTTPAMPNDVIDAMEAEDKAKAETKDETPKANDISALASEILAKTGEGPAIAKSTARRLARRCNNAVEIHNLAFQIKNSTKGDSASRNAAVEQLLTIVHRMIELELREPARFTPFANHGVYGGLTPPGTYGIEAGVASKRADGSHAHTGIGIYLRCEHLEPNDGIEFDSSGLIKK
jgi:hypothetical protein